MWPKSSTNARKVTGNCQPDSLLPEHLSTAAPKISGWFL